ncbi:MAG TPA: DmsE family decaheme c-type cytochrome [Syntrophales bacterium]|nr:DmsE family decaheme c-type cytochrome [Syntrophales bacterium]
MKKIRVIIAFLIILLLAAPAIIISTQNAESEDGYVGVDTCKACHSNRYESYLKSNHAKKAIPGSPANKNACESCHGPGAAHVQKGGGRGTGMFAFARQADPYEKASRCLSCHQDFRAMSFWNMSRHKVNGISCDRCHSSHSGMKNNLKAQEPTLCIGCHLSIRAQLSKQSHHPLKEGLMKCTQCHNQHGEFESKMIKADSVNELCFKCHAEKRGPFLWEHPPVEENCLTCHVPHGSNHAKLLNSKPPLLCESCHNSIGHPGSIYTSFETFQGTATSSKNRMFARACLNCHSNIHGSMGPSTRGKHFVR